MAKQSKLGICENCGDKGALTGSFGRQVCTTCLKIRSNVNSHLERVAKAAREMGKAEQLLTALVPDGGGLAIKVTADLLQEISGIVGYEGEDPAELVEAVRSKVLTCYSCDVDDVLRRIADVIGYAGVRGDGLVEAVRALIVTPGTAPDRRAEYALRGDLLLACGLALDLGVPQSWDYVTTAAIQTIANLTNRLDDLLSLLSKERADNARLYEEKINRANAAFLHTVGELRNEIARLNGQTHSESEQLTAIRAELTLAQQSRDEWESRAVQAEANVQDQAAELNADDLDLREQLKVARELNDRLRSRAQESESRLIWYREALAVLRARLGLDHLDEDEDVMERILESIAAMTHALSRHQDLASAAEARADHLEGELERQVGANEAQAAVERELRATIAEQSADFERLRNQDLAGNGRDWSTDDSPLLDVALAVIRDEPIPADRIATLIGLARRASA